MGWLLRTALERLLFLIPLWCSLGVHEWAHAAAANALGDDTARRLGRMSLNPLVHLDPVGTVLLPLLGIPFGWAKPVPVEPIRFRPEVPMTRGIVLVAGAGPASNLVLAILLLIVDALAYRSGFDLSTRDPVLGPVFDFALTANFAMAFFNLMPVGPLDGARIVEGLMPLERRALWDQLKLPVGIGAVVLFLFVLSPLLVASMVILRGVCRGTF